LKPENLLFLDEKATVLKLADFGTAEIVGKNTLLYATVGSPGFKIILKIHFFNTKPILLRT
jgi:serine/threonine protein kinase